MSERWEWFGADLVEIGDDPEGSDGRVILSVAGDWPTPEEARLISAGPDLLDALKKVIAVADRKTDEFDAARAAISKAEGRS